MFGISVGHNLHSCIDAYIKIGDVDQGFRINIVEYYLPKKWKIGGAFYDIAVIKLDW